MFNFIIRGFIYSLKHTDELSVQPVHKIGLRTPVWVTEAHVRVMRRTCQVQRRTWLFRRRAKRRRGAEPEYRGARLYTEAPHLIIEAHASPDTLKRCQPLSRPDARLFVEAHASLAQKTVPKCKIYRKTANFSKISLKNSNQQIYSL